MNIGKILERFSIMAELDLDDASQWIGLMEESAAEIKSQLKEDINESEYEDRLNAAAAVLSFYKYTLCLTSRSAVFSTSDGISMVTASITDRKNMISAASSAWKSTRASISNILKDPGFIFQGVR